jgi:hypothetical protein
LFLHNKLQQQPLGGFMYRPSSTNGCVGARTALAVLLALLSGAAHAESDGHVLYLSEYLYGDYYYAALGDVDRYPRPIRPRKLQLPGSFRAGVELGNHDVSPSGKTIVFAARNTVDYDWDIYTGTIDLRSERIRDVKRIVRNVGTRDEDPRFSWDGSQIVYKCAGDICMYPDLLYQNPIVASWCELWGPSMDASGYRVSFTKRCEGASDDRIWQFDLLAGVESPVPKEDGATDRFAQFLDDGRIVYSHIGADVRESSLWVYDSGSVSLLHDRTESDDDPYVDKHDRNHIAFIGWSDDGYSLYIYRRSRGDSVRLSYGLRILAPVLFR